MNIVQIGVCQANDDLTKIITDQPNILVLVEPLMVHNDKILECYDWVNNKHLENVVIFPTLRDKMTFFYHENDGPLYEVASLKMNHILKHGYGKDGIVRLDVECLTINLLFDKYKLLDIDILYIDAEGTDDLIIKSIDFEKYNIKNIYFENLHLNNVDIYHFLEEKGFSVTKKVGMAGWSSHAFKKEDIE